MSLTKSKLRLVAALAALATLALAGSCRGFFVKPTLSSIAVGPPSPTINTGTTNNTVQMFAVGTFNDGSSGNPSVSWTISPTGFATISNSGLVTSVATGTTTITATSNANPSISGTQPLTVTVACTTAITINPSTGGSLTPTATTAEFTASCNGGIDITEAATWVSSNTSIATVTAGVVTATQTANGTFTITASSGGVTSAPISITASDFTTSGF